MSGKFEAGEAAAAHQKFKAQGSSGRWRGRPMPKSRRQVRWVRGRQEEEGEKDVNETFKSIMTIMKSVAPEVVGMKSEVGDVKTAVAQANDAAREAIEIAQRIEVKVTERKTDIETERKSRESWQAGMEKTLLCD